MKNPTTLAKLAWLFARKYRVTTLGWLVVLIFGLLSYNTYLDREGFPPIELPIAVVQGQYSIDDASALDQQLTQPINQAASQLEEVSSFSSTTRRDGFTVVVNFADDTELTDGVAKLRTAITNQVQLPQDATLEVVPIEPTKFDNRYNLIFSVFDQADSDYADLQPIAEAIAEQVAVDSAVDSAELVPIIEEVPLPDSQQTIQRQNGVNFVGIRQGDDFNYYPAVSVGITGADNIDAITLSESVDKVLTELEDSPLTEQVNTKITADFASTINQQINSLEDNLLSGLVAVVIIAWLLISWRAALVIALFIPTVLAASFIGLNLGGLSLNTITLFATILTLGLFVDDATIVVEAIEAQRKGRKQREAIMAAIKRVGTASLAGTLTTILVFTPMLAVSGILGEFIGLLPITVILSLSVSFVISIVLAPFLSRLFVLSANPKSKLAALDRLNLSKPVQLVADKLAGLPLLNRDRPSSGRWLTAGLVGFSILIIGAGVFISSKLPLSIFPQSKDSNTLLATVDLTRNQANLGRPAADVATDTQTQVASQLNDSLYSVLGQNLDYITYQSPSPRSLTLEIGLIDFKQRDATSLQLLEELRSDSANIDGFAVDFTQLDAGPPEQDFPFVMRVVGSQAVIEDATNQITDFIANQQLTVTDTTVNVDEVQTDQDGAIRRSDGGQFQTISANFDNKDLTSGSVEALEKAVAAEFDSQRLGELGLADDALDFDVGQESQNAESFESITFGLIAAIAGMYLLLVILFNSLSQPLLILLAIPFSLFGVFGGLYLTDNPLSFFVMVGILGLIGIVVNNSILLTEYANQERDAGQDRWQAISSAVRDRFRPLVTTTLTTIFALLPLALSDPFWQPLAFTLIFGMLSSTLLIIISFPYYYLGLERIRDWKNRRWPALN